MKTNTQLVIIDTEIDVKEKIINSDVIFWKKNKFIDRNNKIIEISLKNNKYLIEQKKILCRELKKYYDKLSKKFPNKNLYNLEVFNIRNDKIRMFDKFIFFSLVKILINKKKYKKILVFSDNENYGDFYKSLCIDDKQNLKIDYLNSKREKISYKLSAIFFILKSLLITIYVKLFFTNKLQNYYENCCLSLYPNFYQETNENFFKNKYLKLNFIIGDEVLIGNNLGQKISHIKKLQNLKDLLIVEKFISIKDLISKFFKINSLNNEIKSIDEEKIFYNKIDISQVINDYTKISLYNAFKFEIYENSLFKPFTKHRIKKFHYYMFEYNFGFFLSTYLRKNFNKIHLIGYQHGIFSEKLMWMRLFQESKIKKLLSPNKIVTKFRSSIPAYKKFFYSKVELSKDKEKNIPKFIFKKNSKKKENILVFLGLHDEQQMIDQLHKINHYNKSFKFYLKYHPKSKKKEMKDNEKFNVIKSKNNIKFDSIVLSQSSTMIYKLINSKQKFYILRINTVSSLLPKLIEEKVKYLN